MVKPEIRPVSGFRDEPRVIVLGHDQTVADRISRRDPSPDVPWQPQAIRLRDERDYQRLLQGLEQTVGQFGWDLLSFVLMPNHVHRFPITQNRP